jgi:aryl-alcohol dehydrogenase-like predicted oxidoreductase
MRTRHISSERTGVRHGEPGAEEETFAAVGKIRGLAEEAGIPTAQLAIAWLLHQPGVTSVIAGARSPEQVKTNAVAASLVLSSDVLARLAEITEPLKVRFGTNIDMWQTAARSRIR